MSDEPIIPDKLFSERGKEVELIFREAVRQAIWRHKRLGQSVAASKDGKVVIVPPEEIPVDDQPIWQPSKRSAALRTDGEHGDDKPVEPIEREEPMVMQNAQEIYPTIRVLPSTELLRLAALILDDLARAANSKSAKEPALDLAEISRDRQGAKAERRARDIEIINQNADQLNEEAMDALSYQA